MSKIKLSSMVAIAQNHVIGKDNDLLWHIPEDFKHFKRTTMGCPLVMGRKTFESLPGALKGRTHIIISRSAPDTATAENNNDPNSPKVHYVTSIEESIALGKKVAKNDQAEEIFIIGGGEIYKQTMPLIDRLYITLVHQDYEGDTYFPQFNWDEWNITHEDRHEAKDNKPAFTFYTLDQK